MIVNQKREPMLANWGINLAHYKRNFIDNGHGSVLRKLDQFRIILIGDSTTYGRGANPSGLAGVEGAHINSPVRQLSRKLAGLGITADSKSVVGLGNNNNSDSVELFYNNTPEISVDLEGWQQLPFLSIGGDLYKNGGAGILKFSFVAVDRIAIGLPVRTYGVARYRLDGGSWASVSLSGTTDLMRIAINTTIGNHVVELERVSGTAYVSYVESWDSSKEVQIISWGARGYTSTDLIENTRPWHTIPALSEIPFDAVVLNIGINDIRSGGAGTSKTVYESNVTTFVNAIRSENSNAVIFIQIPNDISTGLSYLPASITALAALLNLTLLDTRLAVDMATWAESNTAGHMYDNLHPTDTGYDSQWTYFAPIIHSKIKFKRLLELN